MAKGDSRRDLCKSSRITRRLAFAVLGVLLAGVAFFGSGCNSERPAVEPQPHSESGTVVLEGHLSRDTVSDDEILRFWITVENRTSLSLNNLRIAELDTPGFKKLRWCWGRNAAAKGCVKASEASLQISDSECADANDGNSAGADEWLLCRSLKSGESFTAWGDLSVSDASLPPERLYAVVSWQGVPDNPASANGKNSAATAEQKGLALTAGKPAVEVSSRVVSLGTAEPVTELHVLTWLTKPEISIPGAIAVLGLCFTWLAARRDERSKVFNAMLGSAHDAAVRYFMPMSGVLSSALLAIRKAGTEDPPVDNARRGFYYITMFHWWQRRVFNEVGAYQLSSRVGERLLLKLAAKHRELYPRASESEWRRLDVILSDLEKETTLDEFLGTLDGGDADWAAAWADYANWIKSEACKRDIVFLGAFIEVMVYEVNGLHKLWYGVRSPMRLDDATREAILEVATGEFKYEVQNYLLKAENRDTTLRLWD